MEANDPIAQLWQISDRMRSINDRASRRLAASSREPDLMATAYAAIKGEVSGAAGMSALRAALRADGVTEDRIEAIDALYLRCLLDPSL